MVKCARLDGLRDTPLARLLKRCTQERSHWSPVLYAAKRSGKGRDEGHL